MNKRIQLTIAEPCHENWDNMTPVDKGKFCGSCQKQVVDFTSMSDTQVAAFFKKPTTGSVCGRFMNDQLDRDIAIPRKRIPWIKYFFQLSLPLFLASLKANAQKGRVSVKQVTTVPKSADRPTFGMVSSKLKLINTQNELRGMIVNEDGKPVPYASVVIKGTNIGAPADSSGFFSFHTKATTDLTDSVWLKISSVGYKDKEIAVPAIDYRDNSILTITLDKQSLPEVTVIAYPVQGRLTGTVGSVCIVRSHKSVKDSIPSINNKLSLINVYPNPAAAGQSVNIDCSKLKQGHYSFQLINLSGQLILQKEVNVNEKEHVVSMLLPPVTAGIYFVTMIADKGGKKFSTKMIIQ